MKEAVSFFIGCFLILSVRAQQYHPLLDSGAVWNQTVTYGDWNNGPVYFTTGYHLFTLGDTVIQSVTFKKLWAEPTFAYTIDNGSYSGGNFTADPVLIGGLMEDPEMKVWFRPLKNSEGFGCNDMMYGDSVYLMYDFGVSVGDSIQSMYYPSLVDSMDSVQLLNGEYRKRYWLNNIWNNEVWIEGIGSSRGLLSSQDYLFECLSNLCCYIKGNEVLYSGSYDFSIIADCGTFLLLVYSNPFSKLILELSPNPATDFLTIHFSSPDYSTAEIRIADLLGRNLFSGEIKSGESRSVSTEKWSGSVVHCQLWKGGELLTTRKVVIQ